MISNPMYFPTHLISTKYMEQQNKLRMKSLCFPTVDILYLGASNARKYWFNLMSNFFLHPPKYKSVHCD